MASDAFMYLSFTIWESEGDVYVNSLHRVTSTWQMQVKGTCRFCHGCCKTVFPKGMVKLF